MLFGLPLGLLLYLIKIPILRHFYSTVVGILLAFFVYKSAIISILIYIVLSYILIYIFGKKSGQIVFIFSLIYLSSHHIYR